MFSDDNFRGEKLPLRSAIERASPLDGEEPDSQQHFEGSVLLGNGREGLDDGGKESGKLDEACEGVSEGEEDVEGEREGDSELHFELLLESEERELGERYGGDVEFSAVKSCTRLVRGSIVLANAESE